MRTTRNATHAAADVIVDLTLEAVDQPADDVVPSVGDDAPLPDEASRDLVSALCADVAQVPLLSRDEEEGLGRLIAARRHRILALLRTQPGLVSAALDQVGRGLVHPDDGFREREAQTVLTYARRRLEEMPPRSRAGKALGSFVDVLDQEVRAYRQLRDVMMTANVRLVMVMARRYRHSTLSFLDLVQEGVLGLIRAVEKYEPSRAIRFSTYAVWWIWQQITRAADCQGSIIRTPVHWNQFRRRLGRQLPEEIELDPDTLAAVHGISPERVAAMVQPFQCLSLAAPLGEDQENRTLADTLPADTSANPERTVVHADISQRLAVAVDELPEREAQILRLRFGLSGSRSHTLEEVGERFGVSRERIRQLESRALRRMRVICHQRGLSDLLR